VSPSRTAARVAPIAHWQKIAETVTTGVRHHTLRRTQPRGMACVAAARVAPRAGRVDARSGRARVRATRRTASSFAARTSASKTRASETTTSPVDDARDVCDVAVVGAGPGGLAAALALQRQGYDVRVFEQREAFRPAGVAVFIWPHGLQHLKRIDPETCARVIAAGATIDTIAVERLDPGATEPEELLTINVAGWSERMDLPPQIGITWARLTDALRAGLEPGTVFLGHALDTVRDDKRNGVTLTFAPTRSGAPAPPAVRARVCVIGADGRNSKVRAAVFGDEEDRRWGRWPNIFKGGGEKSDSKENNANVYYALSPNPPPGCGASNGCLNELRFSLCDGSGISLLDVGRGNLDLPFSVDGSVGPVADASSRDGTGQLMFGTTRFSEQAVVFETPEERLRHLRGMFTETTDLISAAIASTDADLVVQTTLYERNGAKEWSKGRVALLGDAAHCMYPSLGLGISTAFADAVELKERLENKENDEASIEEALLLYSQRRGPYARLLQTVSRLMHSVLAATAETPRKNDASSGDKNAFSRLDPSAAFFKMWQGALWVFGDR
jgi:salicylate hydroxylase